MGFMGVCTYHSEFASAMSLKEAQVVQPHPHERRYHHPTGEEKIVLNMIFCGVAEFKVGDLLHIFPS